MSLITVIVSGVGQQLSKLNMPLYARTLGRKANGLEDYIVKNGDVI